jgi:adenine-specific DNA-methyltransferase
MLDHVAERTSEYILSKPKDMRKSLGQFFTSKATARFMASLFNFPQKEKVEILDPGAGSGILSAAIIEIIDKYHNTIPQVSSC